MYVKALSEDYSFQGRGTVLLASQLIEEPVRSSTGLHGIVSLMWQLLFSLEEGCCDYDWDRRFSRSIHLADYGTDLLLETLYCSRHFLPCKSLTVGVWNRREKTVYLDFYCYTWVAVQNNFVLNEQSGHLQAIQIASSLVNDSIWPNLSTQFLRIQACILWCSFYLCALSSFLFFFFSFLFNACDLALHHVKKI